jgi:phospholipase/carboxylesterase
MRILRDSELNTIYAGAPFSEASAAMILIHGRGADADDILSLAEELQLDNFSFAAPQAENNTWYPYSFLEPVERNEPYLSSSLKLINTLTGKLIDEGFNPENIFYLGFSQGACLALEYCARYPKKYGGVFALSGGLIGKEGGNFEYNGSFQKTPVFLGCSDVDPHIPIERVNLTGEIFNNMDAVVTKRIYPGMGHNVNTDEIAYMKNLLKTAE